MALHLLKLCVGADSIQDLEEWIRTHRRGRSKSAPRQHEHVTRMVPKRSGDLLAGGSLFWVIRGEIMCRQALADIVPFVDREGIGRCRIVMDATVVPVEPRPCRAFQGWRYLATEDAPPDLAGRPSDAPALPDELRRELRALGLL